MQPLGNGRHDEWDSFVDVAGGTIFHKAWWYRAWGVNFDIYARVNEKGEVQAGMPVCLSNYGYGRLPKFLGIRGLSRPPLTLVNGPLFRETAKAARCSRYSHAKKEVLAAISSLPEVDFYDILLHRFQDDLMPYIWNGFDTQVYYTYVISRDEAGVWRKNMFDSARNNLNKSHREFDTNGYFIEVDPPMEDQIPLYYQTARLRGYSNELDSIAANMPGWWSAVKAKDAGRSYLLRDRKGKPLCGTMMVWDRHTAYSIISGMDPEVGRRDNLNMLLWERKITDALEMGLDFDFEGSTLMGVEGFFRGWGGKLHTCFRVTKMPSFITYIGLKGYRYLKFHRKKEWVK